MVSPAKPKFPRKSHSQFAVTVLLYVATTKVRYMGSMVTVMIIKTVRQVLLCRSAAPMKVHV